MTAVFHWLGLVGCAPTQLDQAAANTAHWCAQERPAHVVVSDALPEDCQLAVCDAVAWWSTQSVTYLTCAVVPDESLSPGYPDPLFIQVVTTPPEDSGATGDTRIHRITEDCIDSAEIRMDPDWCAKGNTEAHELGHALGLGHVNDPKNLMWTANLPGGYVLNQEQLEQVR